MSNDYLQGKADGLRLAADCIREWSSWGTQSIGTMLERLKQTAEQEEAKMEKAKGA